jgi:hypothetical protein
LFCLLDIIIGIVILVFGVFSIVFRCFFSIVILSIIFRRFIDVLVVFDVLDIFDVFVAFDDVISVDVVNVVVGCRAPVVLEAALLIVTLVRVLLIIWLLNNNNNNNFIGKNINSNKKLKLGFFYSDCIYVFLIM